MSKESNQSLLIDNPEQSLFHSENGKGYDEGKCILKVEHNIITEVQETKNNVFNCDIQKIIGKPVESILPEYQPDGNLSIEVYQNLINNLQLGHPITSNLQIKTTSNQLFYSEVNIFTFEKDKVFLTLSPKKFEISTMKQTIASQDSVTIQNLIVDGSLMFKCYDVDGSVYYLNSAYLEFTGTSFNRQLKEGWLQTVSEKDRTRIRTMVKNAIKHHEKYSITYQLERADNELATVYESGIPVFNRNGEFNGIAAALIDLTHSESKIDQSPSKLFSDQEDISDLTDAAPVLFKMSDSKNEFYYFSNQWNNFTGKTLKEQRDDGWYANVYEQDVDTVKSSIEAAFSKRKKYGIVYRIYNSKKQLR